MNEMIHTSKFKRSLILIGQLGNEGYVIIVSKHSWNIMKGSMMLVRGEKIGNLYLTSNAPYINDASSLKNYNLFYRCLDHKKPKRGAFNLIGEKVKNLEHEYMFTSGLALEPSLGNSNSYVSSSSEK